MKITILTSELKKGINFTERVAGKNLTLPILNNLLLEATSNFLKITATDLEVGIQWWGLCKTETEGKITIPAKVLAQLINSIPDDKIDISTKNNTLYVSSKNIKTQIKGFDSEEFPLIPEFSKNTFIEVNGQKLKNGLVDVVDIASPSQVRPEISGIYFILGKNNIKLVATDSFRLAEKTISFSKAGYKNNFNEEIKFILPQKTAKEIINMIGEEDKTIKVYLSESQVLFETSAKETEHPEVNLISREIEGEYPSYQEIIPKEWKTKALIKKDELIKQIKLAGLFSGKINEVKFKIQEKEMEIYSQDADMGESSSIVDTKTEGKPLDVSFNWKFVLDGLAKIKSSEVLLELQSANSAGVIKPVGTDDYLYVIMPIKR